MASGKGYNFNERDGWITGIDWDAAVSEHFKKYESSIASSMIYGTDPATKVEVCVHEWVNVGFTFDKFICKKCNCEKK